MIISLKKNYTANEWFFSTLDKSIILFSLYNYFFSNIEFLPNVILLLLHKQANNASHKKDKT
jgi:hypothetical protein